MSEFIRLYQENPNTKSIVKIVECLRNGGVIIYPTDTVYALGCDINNTKALKRLASVKRVNLEKANFSFICFDLKDLSVYTKQLSTPTYKILNRALPGSFTFILKGSRTLPKVFKNKKTVGIRVPQSNITRALVKELGNPIVSTSIHHDDEIIEYMSDPQEIYEKYKSLVDIVIDGGFIGNTPSTVIDLSDETPVLIREGKGDFNTVL
ncbi:L-threonylcarbamoyladenylate synthase [Ichthyobacterium seriolicida]|uniref:Hypothetical YciO protein, TsaC/YrdC paralog n=1 Tax=Ichthyobacterium seriolicida TaxID=242600 RepID=A0A1J1E3C2_9FLAO|nr:L-threonylcarbamoyladenylate synthase [Ichthyobacterium seriolicida]BAV95485.1 hypothetical YciO protein, TsaC/YrdC paralog [Ichthyobacterium seriolicida]